MANFLYIPRGAGGDSRRYTAEQLRESVGAQTPEFETFMTASSPGDYAELPAGTFVRLGSEFKAPAL